MRYIKRPMKKTLILVLGLIVSSQAFAAPRVLTGRDDQGKPCALEFLRMSLREPGAVVAVRPSYTGSVSFELVPSRLPSGAPDKTRLYGSRKFYSAATQSEFELIYFPRERRFMYGEMRTNIRTGDVFFERYLECRLGQ